MRKIFIIFLSLFLCVNVVNAAAVRSQNSVIRSDTTNVSSRQKNTTKVRTAVPRTTNQNTKQNNVKKVSARNATNTKTVATRSVNVKKKYTNT